MNFLHRSIFSRHPTITGFGILADKLTAFRRTGLKSLRPAVGRWLHGPFSQRPRILIGGMDAPWPAGHGLLWERRAHDVQLAEGPPAETKRATGGGSKIALAIGVRTAGMYRLTARAQAVAASISEAQARQLLRSGRLRLTNRGRSVTWMSDQKGSSLVFFGEALESIYTSDKVYALEMGPRSGSISRRDASTMTPAPGLSFQASVHAEEDRLPATVLGLDPETDYWFAHFEAFTLFDGEIHQRHRNKTDHNGILIRVNT